MRTIAFAAVLLASAVAVSALTNCASSDGKYDLSSIGGTDISGTDNTYNYKLQLCGTATETSCAQNGGSFCQYNLQNAYSHVLAKWDSSAQWSDCPAATCPNGGATVYIANGDKCNGSGPNRAVTFNIACPAAGAASSTTYTILTSGCIYTVTMTNSAGCPTSGGGGGGGGGGGDDGGKKGLSGGSIFLIILVVVIPVYVVIGCVYKRQRQGTSGMESCPNIDFWRDLPSLVGDGFKFTWRKCLGLCGKGDATYEGMK